LIPGIRDLIKFRSVISEELSMITSHEKGVNIRALYQLGINNLQPEDPVVVGNDTASHPRSTESSAAPLRKLQNRHRHNLF
jgi:hypothetical protein